MQKERVGVAIPIKEREKLEVGFFQSAKLQKYSHEKCKVVLT